MVIGVAPGRDVRDAGIGLLLLGVVGKFDKDLKQ